MQIMKSKKEYMLFTTRERKTWWERRDPDQPLFRRCLLWARRRRPLIPMTERADTWLRQPSNSKSCNSTLLLVIALASLPIWSFKMEYVKGRRCYLYIIWTLLLDLVSSLVFFFSTLSLVYFFFYIFFM